MRDAELPGGGRPEKTQVSGLHFLPVVLGYQVRRVPAGAMLPRRESRRPGNGEEEKETGREKGR